MYRTRSWRKCLDPTVLTLERVVHMHKEQPAARSKSKIPQAMKNTADKGRLHTQCVLARRQALQAGGS